MILVSPVADSAAAGVLGLLAGSFLNVVIHRLPRMLEAQWAVECAELSGKESAVAAPFNLMQPRVPTGPDHLSLMR